MSISILDRAVAPPANVAARVRVMGCDGAPLERRLSSDEFELAENEEVLSELEAKRAILPVSRETSELVLVALDLSGSVTRSELRDTMISGVERLIEGLDPRSTIAIFGFDGRPDLIPFAYFTTDRKELALALDEVSRAPTVDDSTNLNGAVVGAIGLLDQAVRSAEDDDTVAHGSLVVFSDGSDRAARVSHDEAKESVEESPHAAYAVAVGGEIDESALADLAPSGVAHADEPEGLLDAFEEVGELLSARAATDYIVSYCSPARAGQRTLQIRVRDGSEIADATLDFRADGFGAGCTPEKMPLR
jgi:hypothetical protein